MTGTRPIGMWPEVLGALAAWVAVTALMVAVAPTLVAVPTPLASAVVAVVFLGIGYGVALALPEGRGARFGVAVVVIGQLLDVVLVLAADRLYPRTDIDGTAHILLLLLVGYATFLAGAILGGRSSTESVAGPRR